MLRAAVFAISECLAACGGVFQHCLSLLVHESAKYTTSSQHLLLRYFSIVEYWSPACNNLHKHGSLLL